MSKRHERTFHKQETNMANNMKMLILIINQKMQIKTTIR